MKRFLPLFAGTWVLGLSTPAACQIPKIDALLEQRVELKSQQEAPLDDYLIRLAQGADVNFIADATQFPPDAKVQPYPASAAAIAGVQGVHQERWRRTLLNLIADVAAEHHLSHLRQGERTFLFWSEPDVRELGRLIAQENASLPALTVAGYKETERQLSDYLQRLHNWNPDAPQPDLKLRFADLPPELRASLSSVVRAEVSHAFEDRGFSISSRTRRNKIERIVTEKISFKAPDTVWFSDEFWKNARIKGYSQSEPVTGSNPPQTRTAPYLVIGGAVSEQDTRTTFAPIGRLDDVPFGR